MDLALSLDAEQTARLERIAKARRESPVAVVAEAVAQYLDYDAWIRGEVEKGLASLERGEGRDFADVARDMRARFPDATSDAAE